MQRDIEATIRLAHELDQFYLDHEAQFREAEEAASAVEAALQLARAGDWPMPPLR